MGPEVEAVLVRVWEESEPAENSVQLLDAVQREVHHLIAVGAFEAYL